MAFPYDLLCFDNDGTLAISGQPIGDIVPRLMKLREQYGTQLMMITNNSSKDDLTYQAKLEQMGFGSGAVELISPVAVAAKELATRGLTRGYILGNPLCIGEFSRRGIQHDDKTPRFVLVAYDTTLTYEKLTRACTLVKSGLPLFQSHIDPVCPGIEVDLPDCGLMINLVSVPTNTQPLEIFGKESEAYARYLKTKVQPGARAVIVGDRLRTDIALGQRLGWDSVWINKSGAVIEADLKPKFIDTSFAEFLARFGQ